ncbi:MAG: hypothetical protein ACI8W3_003007 [Myxococcota bacterium]|jgi:hypothetical protein
MRSFGRFGPWNGITAPHISHEGRLPFPLTLRSSCFDQRSKLLGKVHHEPGR